MSLGGLRVQREGVIHGLARPRQAFRRRVVCVHRHVSLSQQGVGLDEVGIVLDRSLEHLNRELLGLPRPPRKPGIGVPRVLLTPQVRLVGLHALGGPRLQGRLLLREQRDAELLHHRLGDLGLGREDVVQDAVVAVRPDVRVVGDADEPWRDANAPRTFGSVPAHRPSQHEADAELLSDLPHGFLRSLVADRAAARDDTQAAHPCEPARDLLGHPRGEVGVLGCAQVLEGEDDEHLPLGGSRLVWGPRLQRADRQGEHRNDCPAGEPYSSFPVHHGLRPR